MGHIPSVLPSQKLKLPYLEASVIVHCIYFESKQLKKSKILLAVQPINKWLYIMTIVIRVIK